MRKTLLILSLLFVSFAGQAATVYISDTLTVPLRRGPSNGHKILHAGLPSGMALEVLGEDKQAGFTHVRTPNGTEGWVPTQYLTNQPIARDRLAAATKRVETLEAEIKTLRESLQEARSTRTESERSNAQLIKQNQDLQAQLAEIRRVSASAVAHYEENQLLKAQLETLKARNVELTGRVRELERDVMLRWFLAGGGLVLLGLILGSVLKSRPKRSVWA